MAGRPPILDEFTNLPVSRQRKWQLRQNAKGRCVICGQPRPGHRTCCDKHAWRNTTLAKARHAKTHSANAQNPHLK